MKIGVFDSGLGGLTVVDAIVRTFKGVRVYYVADTQAAPYGEKSKEQILKYSLEVTKHLIKEFNIDALIVACNTATSAAINDLRKTFPDLLIIGTEPGIKPAVNYTKTGKVGVLATPATLKGEKYQLLADELSTVSCITLYEQPCPGLVERIEQGNTHCEDTADMLHNWLTPMKQNSVDTIVLGCTHYPLISHIIKDIMGDDINLVQTGYAIANRLKELSFQKGHILNDDNIDVYVYFTGEINLKMVDNILDRWNKGGKIMIRGNN
ncbi:MAG: glutamate racemase [Campylobacterota bacterium]|nr:glutamate racemase [Campylobacterota bacterium]